MICSDLTNRIKVILGFRYTSQILDFLDIKRIYNAKGKPFSRSYITHVVNGIREDIRVEAAIIELCNNKKKQYKNFSNMKKEILSK